MLQAQLGLRKRIQELEAELEANQASVNKLQAENKRFREREQEELWELVSPRAETARQEPAGCETAARLQAAKLEAAAESLKIPGASLGPLKTFHLLQKDAEERSPDLAAQKTYMRHPESGLAARLQSQEGQELSSGAAEASSSSRCALTVSPWQRARARAHIHKHTHTNTHTHRLSDMLCGRCVWGNAWGGWCSCCTASAAADGAAGSEYSAAPPRCVHDVWIVSIPARY